jgi:hypothetical protein
MLPAPPDVYQSGGDEPRAGGVDGAVAVARFLVGVEALGQQQELR